MLQQNEKISVAIGLKKNLLVFKVCLFVCVCVCVCVWMRWGGLFILIGPKNNLIFGKIFNFLENYRFLIWFVLFYFQRLELWKNVFFLVFVFLIVVDVAVVVVVIVAVVLHRGWGYIIIIIIIIIVIFL